MTNRERSNNCKRDLSNSEHQMLRHGKSEFIHLDRNIFTEVQAPRSGKKIHRNHLKETYQKSKEKQCFPYAKDLKINSVSIDDPNKLSMIVNTKRRYGNGKWPNCNHEIKQYKLSKENSMYLWTNDKWSFPFDKEYEVFDDLTSFDLMYVWLILSLEIINKDLFKIELINNGLCPILMCLANVQIL